MTIILTDTTHPALHSLKVKSSEEEFRQLARNNKVDDLKAILKTSKSCLLAKCPFTGKTAAHFAAEKGYANVLRLLHSMGDPFTVIDNTGRSVEEYAANKECKDVCKLVESARRTLEIVDKIIPNKLDVDNGIDPRFLYKRAERTDKVKEIAKSQINKIIAKLADEIEKKKIKPQEQTLNKITTWIDQFYQKLTFIHDCSITLNTAMGKSLTYGACGENSRICFTFLSNVVKNTFSLDYVNQQIDAKANHGFVVLNLDQQKDIKDLSAWKNALVIDAYIDVKSMGIRSFFYDNISDINQSTLVTTIKSDSLTLFCNNKVTTCPKELWADCEIPAMMQKLIDDLSSDNEKLFIKYEK